MSHFCVQTLYKGPHITYVILLNCEFLTKEKPLGDPNYPICEPVTCLLFPVLSFMLLLWTEMIITGIYSFVEQSFTFVQ